MVIKFERSENSKKLCHAFPYINSSKFVKIEIHPKSDYLLSQCLMLSSAGNAYVHRLNCQKSRVEGKLSQRNVKRMGKWLKPWQMGTHMLVFKESSPMNTITTGFRWFKGDLWNLKPYPYNRQFVMRWL